MSTEIVLLAAAPVLMVTVSLFESRWGPVVAGMVAAAPMTALIGLLLVSSDLGEVAGHEMAIRMSGYISAQIALAVVVAASIGRSGPARGLALGTAVYAVVAGLAAVAPPQLTVTVSLAALFAGRTLVRAPEPEVAENRRSTVTGWWLIVVRAIVSLLTAVGLLVIAHQAGPAAGGAVGAFPIFTLTLSAFIYGASGPAGVRSALAGMVRGLPAYFAFVLVFGLTIGAVGTIAAAIAGVLACVVCYLVPTWATQDARQSNEAALVDG